MKKMVGLEKYAIQNCINHAVDFLISKVENNEILDSWHGHNSQTPYEATTNVFLTFFLTKALHVTGSLNSNCRDKILTIINNSLVGNVYSYSLGAPPDADDTAFALRTLLLLGEKISSNDIQSALSTFEWNNSWTTFNWMADKEPRNGWTIEHIDDRSLIGIHPEVHLNILCLLNESNKFSSRFSLSNLPRYEGLFQSYHYTSRMYSSWLASSLLDDTNLRLIQKSVMLKQSENGLWLGHVEGFSNVLETALALLLTTNMQQQNHTLLQNAVKAICSEKNVNGSWYGGIIWKYHVTVEGGGGYWFAKDAHNILGTSLVLLALHKLALSVF